MPKTKEKDTSKLLAPEEKKVDAVEADSALSSKKSLLAFSAYKGLIAKQSRKGCIKAAMSCSPSVETRFAPIEEKSKDVFYGSEKSNACFRCCCPSHHPFTLNLVAGDKKGGPLVASYRRPCMCLIFPCKCCCYQQIHVRDAKGFEVGMVRENCWLCFPSFVVKKPDGTTQYKIHAPTCCCCCTNPCPEGFCKGLCNCFCCGSCRVPFFIYGGSDDKNSKQVGRIVKVWAGLGEEFFGMNKTECEFPASADVQAKARLVGAMLLLNELFYKGDDKDEEEA